MQSRLAAFILQASTCQSRAQNHRLLSALLNGPIGQSGPRLVSVSRDQGYLAVYFSEHVAVFASFRSPLHALGAPPLSSVIVNDDMLIAVADGII